MSEIDYQKLAAAMLARMTGSEGVRGKAVSSTPSTVMGHGPGGLFSHPALERPVFSAMVLPAVGLASALPVRPTVVTDPLFGILTGVTATTGSEANGVCDDPPTAGLAKLCKHSFPLGRLSRQTRVFDLDNFGKYADRADRSDYLLYGNAAGGLAGENPMVPTLPGVAGASQALNNEIAKALFEFGVTWSRDFARLVYSGNPTNNTAGGGYKEFYGLETLVNTGYRDAETGVACPAADSIVRDFGSKGVAANSAEIVKAITYTWRNLKYLASRANLDPVRWALAMSFGMFYELTEIWPVGYLTRSVTVPSGSTHFVDSSDVQRLRDGMRGDLYTRNGQYLMIDGQQVPVVIDDAIPETEVGAGVFESDLYFVPLTVLGGTPVTYWEYFDYTVTGGALEAARILAPGESYYTSDGGRFFWHKKPPTNFCVQVLAKTEPRLLLLTPYLAARISNVRYTPLEHERSPFTESAYFADGGVTSRAGYGPSYYSPTA